MAKEVLFQFNQQTDRSLSTFGNNTRLINVYSNPTPNGRSEFELRSLEGSQVVTSAVPALNGQGCRGLFKTSIGPESVGNVPQIYGVFGDSLFRFNGNTPVFVGQVKNSSEFVTFAESQEQGTTNVKGFVCDGTLIYEWEIRAEDSAVASSYAEIGYIPYVNGSATEKAVPANITYYNYRLIMTCKNSNQWFYSGLNDSIFNDADWYTSEFKNDRTIKAVSNGGSIWLLNNNSLEIWTRSGDATDPFTTPMGNQHNIGLASIQGTAQLDADIYWIGNGDTSTAGIFKGTGTGNVSRISTPGIEIIINAWKYRSQTKAFAYRLNGCSFIVFTSVNDDQTIAYCVETGKWSERSTSNNGYVHYWDVIYTAIGNDGVMYFGTANSNNLCKFNSNLALDHNGYPITREYSSPIFIDNLQRFVIRQIKLDIECGTGPSYIDEPEVYLQVSRDAGKTWGERRMLQLGKRGQYKTQVRSFGFGVARDFVIRFGTSAPIPITFYQMRLTIENCGGV